jgi:hypothetical protein
MPVGEVVALRGSLVDINITDLVALLHAGERSGELIIVGPESHVRMRFHLGRILDIEGAGGNAPDTLRAATRWREGEFEFRASLETAPPPTDATLHEEALRLLRDAAGVHGEDGAQAGPALLDLDRCATLALFVATHPRVRYVCTLSRESMINAEAASGVMDPPAVRRAATAVCAFLHAYQRSSVQRLLVEEAGGQVGACYLPGGDILMVLADPEADGELVNRALAELLDDLAETP